MASPDSKTSIFTEYLQCRPAELEAAIAERPFAYVPFGALEWHGEHLPLGLDGLKAEAILHRVAERTGGVIFPTVYWGACDTMKFPYTFHNSRRSIRKITRGIVKGLSKMGFRVVVLLTGHYPASQVKNVRRAAEWFRKKEPGRFAVGIPEQALATDLGYLGDHAAKWETAIMMALTPELVDLAAAPTNLSYIERTTEHGIWGFDPTVHANVEIGQEVVDVCVDRLAYAVKEVWQNQDQAPFQSFYDAYKEGLKKMVSLSGAIEFAGMDEKKDILRLGRWLYLERKKPRSSKS